jgi:Hemocyanin, copper containing domain
MALTERDGIDVLGNMIEPSDLSPNPQLYGSMHALLHVAASLVHDPDHRHLESFSVLGDLATAMRDPLFYRIHAMVNDVFATYKKTISAYTVDQVNSIYQFFEYIDYLYIVQYFVVGFLWCECYRRGGDYTWHVSSKCA